MPHEYKEDFFSDRIACRLDLKIDNNLCTSLRLLTRDNAS